MPCACCSTLRHHLLAAPHLGDVRLSAKGQPSTSLTVHAQPTVNVTIDTLHLVFSAFGTVHKIATFEKSSGFQALVQYPDNAAADQVAILLPSSD